jgi:hypothetical protein
MTRLIRPRPCGSPTVAFVGIAFAMLAILAEAASGQEENYVFAIAL